METPTEMKSRSYSYGNEYEPFIIKAIQLAKEWETVSVSGGLCESLTVDKFPEVCRALLALHRELQDERRDAVLDGPPREAMKLLEIARCPNCDGSGAYIVPNRNTGDADLQQCQWCAERASLYATKE